eukprot:1626013-Alexandrium_andersonii.AAC.1
MHTTLARPSHTSGSYVHQGGNTQACSMNVRSLAGHLHRFTAHAVVAELSWAMLGPTAAQSHGALMKFG